MDGGDVAQRPAVALIPQRQSQIDWAVREMQAALGRIYHDGQLRPAEMISALVSVVTMHLTLYINTSQQQEWNRLVVLRTLLGMVRRLTGSQRIH